MKKAVGELGVGVRVLSYRIIPDPQYPQFPHHEIIAEVPAYLVPAAPQQQMAFAQQAAVPQQTMVQQTAVQPSLSVPQQAAPAEPAPVVTAPAWDRVKTAPPVTKTTPPPTMAIPVEALKEEEPEAPSPQEPPSEDTGLSLIEPPVDSTPPLTMDFASDLLEDAVESDAPASQEATEEHEKLAPTAEPPSAPQAVTPTRELSGPETEPPTSIGAPSPDDATSEGTDFVSHQAPQEGPIAGVGGLDEQLAEIREVVVLPVRYPEMFDRLGIDAPKGVLMHGPPGCGKTLVARTLASECGAKFFVINGPELVGSSLGESEKNVRDIFAEAVKAAPSLIFFDEIDAIAGSRSDSSSGAEKRLVTQLLTLMDGIKSGKHVIVLAATNLPNEIDPALRRPGRFDREVEIQPPSAEGRREILGIHAERMALGSDVSLADLAERTHGFVGADLAALCKEAGIAALREATSEGGKPPSGAGSIEVSEEHFDRALKKVKPSMMRVGQVDGPKLTWADIGGLEEVKAELQEAIVMPLKQPELFEKMGVRPSKGVLLTGPPGTGKTMIAKAAAGECGVNFLAVQGPQLVSSLVGESEHAIRRIFDQARKVRPCIIFFDEMDAIAPVREEGGDDHHSDRLVAQLLVELDGFADNEGIFCLAATNRPERIDPAVRRPGRFDKVIRVSLPDEESRRRILAVHLTGKALEPTVDREAILEFTAGLSGAEIGEGVRRAAMVAVRNAYGGQGRVEPSISQADLASAFRELRGVEEPEEESAVPAEQAPPPGKSRALVLDDELMPREFAAAALTQAGFEVEKFDRAPKALEALRARHFDLATLDVDMPEMTGLEALAEIRKFLPNLPVIMATGRKDTDCVVTSLRLGVLDFLNKPYTVDAMVEAAQKAAGALTTDT